MMCSSASLTAPHGQSAVAVRFCGVGKDYGRTRALYGVDLQINQGELCVLVGPSGCGKSTLLRLIAGLEEITDGDLYINGRRVNNVPPAERDVAMVFQSYALYPHMTVYHNMAFGLRRGKMPQAEIDQRVRQAAQLLQIEGLLARLPRQLSGGQRQRVAIGRAITRQPYLFLLDEPLSNLDAALRAQTRVEIYNLHRKLHSTMIYVTHDQIEAMTLADRIVLLNKGQVVQVGAPLELYRHPLNLFAAQFLGTPQMNCLSAQLAAADAEGAELVLNNGVRLRVAVDARRVSAGAQVTLGIRPEHVTTTLGNEAGQGGELRGELLLAERLGDSTVLHLALRGYALPLLAKREGEIEIADGAAVGYHFSPAHCHLFDEQGMAFPRIVS
jgi:multiple sugar transport system ATP-binding protein